MRNFVCGCCGGNNLVEKKLDNMSLHGSGLRVQLVEMRVARLTMVRVCLDCGNVMPFVDRESLVILNAIHSDNN